MTMYLLRTVALFLSVDLSRSIQLTNKADARGSSVDQEYEDGNVKLAADYKPHILFILVDDLGFADPTFNRNPDIEPNTTVGGPDTHHIDFLATNGLILRRHYTHKMCSPSRSAIQSGRAPIHVNVNNGLYTWRNPKDPIGGFPGIPRDMTGLGHIMSKGGYRTHMVGKWDVGMATPEHTPAGRGYDTSLVYFYQESDYWSFKVATDECGNQNDLWEHNANTPYPGQPATELLNGHGCNAYNTVGCHFQDELFENRVTEIIQEHPVGKPLFLFWALHSVHGPYDPPQKVEQLVRAQLKSIDNKDTRQHYKRMPKYYALLKWVDSAVGRVHDLLLKKNMYKNTLIVFSSDNGGVPGANQFPLRGVKFSNFEGGIRSAAFVSGGFLPEGRRGKTEAGLITLWDWYSTFAALAGRDPFDPKARKAQLAQPDGYNQWPLISGLSEFSPRKHVEIGGNSGGYSTDGRKMGHTLMGGLIVQDGKHLYKVILGETKDAYAECGGKSHIGSVDVQNMAKGYDGFCESTKQLCGRNPQNACLYDVATDPGEQNNLAPHNVELFTKLLKQVDDFKPRLYSPHRGVKDNAACHAAMKTGVIGPFAFMPDPNRTDAEIAAAMAVGTTGEVTTLKEKDLSKGKSAAKGKENGQKEYGQKGKDVPKGKDAPKGTKYEDDGNWTVDDIVKQAENVWG